MGIIPHIIYAVPRPIMAMMSFTNPSVGLAPGAVGIAGLVRGAYFLSTGRWTVRPVSRSRADKSGGNEPCPPATGADRRGRQ